MADAVKATPPPSLVKRAQMRLSALELQRSPFMSSWEDISTHQQPRAGRFVVSDSNRNPKRYNQIYDNTPMFASRTLAAGLMSGATSPARPWFRLTLANAALSEAYAVKRWLNTTSGLLREIFNRSNAYRALHQGYEELGLFGTWAAIVMPNFDNVIHMHPMTIGEYVLGTNDLGLVDSFGRRFQMTVGQMVSRFGRNNCGQSVRNMYDRHDIDKWIPVAHLIQPNTGRDASKSDNRNMKFESVYLEAGADNDKDALEQSGHRRFPVLAPRWQVTGSDVYGTSPGMEAQGDVRQLQVEQLAKGRAIEFMVNPPLQVPTSYKESARSRLPGGIMHVDMASAGAGVRSAYEVQLDLSHLLEDIADVRERIKSAYYADLFLLIANDSRSGTTATEIAARQEEKMLMIGPVLERLHNELYSPLIDLTFDMCHDAGILPPIPPELEGQDINIEFVSVLAQAQRAVSAQGMDKLISTIGQIAAAKQDPSVWDKLNTDKAIDDYADMFGANPEVMVPDEAVAQIREQRQKQAAAQAAAASVPAMAGAAKDASQVNVGNMRDVLNEFQGYGSPNASEVH